MDWRTKKVKSRSDKLKKFDEHMQGITIKKKREWKARK